MVSPHDVCVICGEYVVEGRMVCPLCEKDPFRALMGGGKMKRSKCRGCGAPIVWVYTTKGKHMPCDPMLVPYWKKDKAPGKVVTTDGAVLSCEFKGDSNTISGMGYVSHFSTCPKAGSFRRK